MLIPPPNPTPQVESSPRASTPGGPVDLADINNARTIGVMLVRSGSNVLDIGAAHGAVAETLGHRHCRVWGVEVDRDAAVDAARWCEQLYAGDVETIDLDQTFPGVRFDAVLFLDVLEHLRRPLDALRKAIGVLAPGGRVIASIPNVAHASVRLQLLAGRFPRTDVGLLDRTHLQFFDRPAIQQMFDAAGLTVFDEFTVVRAIDQTEIDLDLSAVAPDVLRAATRDPESEVYQYVISAGLADGPAQEHDPLSPASFLRRVRHVEREYRRLEGWATDLERQVLDQQRNGDTATAEIRRLEALLERQGSFVADEQARQRQQQVETLEQQLEADRIALAALQHQLSVQNEVLATLRDSLSEREATTAALQRELETGAAAAEEERVRHARVIRLLQQDVAVRQEYIVHLRQQVSAGETAMLDCARTIQSLERHVADVHDAAVQHLARPRYRVADGINRRLLAFGPLHRQLRRWALALLSRG